MSFESMIPEDFKKNEEPVEIDNKYILNIQKQIFTKFIYSNLIKKEGEENSFFLYGIYKPSSSYEVEDYKNFGEIEITLENLKNLNKIIERDFIIYDYSDYNIQKYLTIQYI